MRVVGQTAAAVVIPEDEDDRTAVDVSLPARARRDDSSAQLTEAGLGSDYAEAVTKVWTPAPPREARPGEPLPSSGRRLRKIEEDADIPTRVSAVAPCARKNAAGDDVTRVDQTRPVSSRAQATVIIPRRRRVVVSPVRIACVAVAALLLVAVFLSDRRKAHARAATPTVTPTVVATAHAAPPRAPPLSRPPPSMTAPTASMALASVAPTAEPPAAAPAPPRIAPASPVAPPPPAAQPTVTPADELSAIEAIESGASDRAARIYAALAAAHPTNEAYRETARILRESTKETSR